MDTCKIRPGLHPYTAIEDRSRFQVLGVFPRRTAANTLAFLDRVAAEMPFPVQRVQTDRGQEFFAYGVQGRLRDRRIKFRPVGSAAPDPRAPHAPQRQGRARPAHRARGVLAHRRPQGPRPGLATHLAAWQGFYNHHRPHGALGAGTPAERIAELAPKIPTPEAVRAAYDPSREFIRSQNTRYRWLPTNARVT
jgi:hypothetical protein